MASPDLDRTLAICDLLLGAAHADSHFHDRERERVRQLMTELEAKLSPEIEARIAGFAPSAFDLAATAAAFRGDPVDEKRKLVRLVAAVHDADEELDLDEDEYLRGLGAALELPSEELSGLVLEFEVEELRDSFTRLRKMPPPIPEGARAKPRSEGAVDVDLDD
jgi:uncharacterized tellurite resistance protein B-like protein